MPPTRIELVIFAYAGFRRELPLSSGLQVRRVTTAPWTFFSQRYEQQFQENKNVRPSTPGKSVCAFVASFHLII